jgi:hypothetical protein
MYYTHHFAHAETLAQVKRWLMRIGIADGRIETHTTGIPWIALRVEPEQLDAIRLLIHAIERNDPEGSPSFWDLARQPHGTIGPAAVSSSEAVAARAVPARELIGWHPLDATPSRADPEWHVAGAMIRRYGQHQA